MAITACVKRNVQQNRTGCATMFGSRRLSWGEFQERAARLAGGLKSLGLETGDRRTAGFSTGDHGPLPHSDCGLQMPSQRHVPDGADARCLGPERY